MAVTVIDGNPTFLIIARGGPAGPAGPDILTTLGDILTHDGAASVRLPVGTAGQVLTVSGGAVVWAAPAGGDPLTTIGDLLTHNGASSVRFPVGADGEMLTADSAFPEGIRWLRPDNTVTTVGDLLGFNGIVDRFPVGADNLLLVADSSEPFGFRWGADPAGTQPGVDRFVDKDTTVLNTTTSSDPGSLQHTFTFSVGVDGDYMVHAHYRWSMNDDEDDSFIGRLRLDGSLIGLNDNGRNHQQTPHEAGGSDGGTGSGTNQRFLATIEDIVTINQAGNPHTLELYASGENSETKTIYDSLFVIRRFL